MCPRGCTKSRTHTSIPKLCIWFACHNTTATTCGLPMVLNHTQSYHLGSNFHKRSASTPRGRKKTKFNKQTRHNITFGLLHVHVHDKWDMYPRSALDDMRISRNDKSHFHLKSMYRTLKIHLIGIHTLETAAARRPMFVPLSLRIAPARRSAIGQNSEKPHRSQHRSDL